MTDKEAFALATYEEAATVPTPALIEAAYRLMLLATTLMQRVQYRHEKSGGV